MPELGSIAPPAATSHEDPVNPGDFLLHFPDVRGIFMMGQTHPLGQRGVASGFSLTTWEEKK